jgi:DMSO reductase family type II enzyme heme b subunit
MPSYADSLSEEERWTLAHYVKSLQTQEEPSANIVLKARRISGQLPKDPADPRWQTTPFLAVTLAGQVLAKPRWESHSVDAATVRALYNDQAIAFLLEWDDRFRDVEHRPGPEPELGEFTYPRLHLDRPRTEKLRDAIRLQFPVTIPEGPARPHFFLGGRGRPVALWHWKADLNEAGGASVVKEVGEGFQKPVVEQPGEAQDVTGKGAWERGRWRVIMTRPLVPKDRGKDVTFQVGRLIPFAVQVWDGSNGEKEFMTSLSSWNFLILEAVPPLRVYLFPVFALAIVGLAEWWLIRRVRG